MVYRYTKCLFSSYSISCSGDYPIPSEVAEAIAVPFRVLFQKATRSTSVYITAWDSPVALP